MKIIKRIKLKNFGRFQDISIGFQKNLNLLIGDNEAGKSTILNAIDFVLSSSRSKVENYGVDNLFNTEVIESFLESEKKYEDLPVFFADHQETTGSNDAYWNSYAIAKVGLMKFMNQLALEYSENYNLYSYGYNTGWVDTDLSRASYPDSQPDWLAVQDGRIAHNILKLFDRSHKNGNIIPLKIK